MSVIHALCVRTALLASCFRHASGLIVLLTRQCNNSNNYRQTNKKTNLANKQKVQCYTKKIKVYNKFCGKYFFSLFLFCNKNNKKVFQRLLVRLVTINFKVALLLSTHCRVTVEIRSLARFIKWRRPECTSLIQFTHDAVVMCSVERIIGKMTFRTNGMGN